MEELVYQAPGGTTIELNAILNPVIIQVISLVGAHCMVAACSFEGGLNLPKFLFESYKLLAEADTLGPSFKQSSDGFVNQRAH